MTEFEAQVLADLSVLKSQMGTLLGDGNSGRIAAIEGRVDQHERSFQRAKGFGLAMGAALTVVQVPDGTAAAEVGDSRENPAMIYKGR